MILTRAFLADGYAPATALEVRLRLEYSGTIGVTALGLAETLPEGWTYTTLGSGAVPAFGLQQGRIIEFIWISVPAFPAEFTYFVLPPANAAGIQPFTGAATYRSSGPELSSNTAASEIGPLPPPPVTIDLAPLQDTTLYETEGAEAELANGGGDFLFAGRTGQGRERRGLLQFDIAAALPPGATILSVQLTLTLTRTQDDAPLTTGLLQFFEPWTEGSVNAPGNEGGGAPAATGDTTWRFLSFPSTAQVPGGLLPGLSDATLDVNGLGAYTWTSELMADRVQDWLDTPAENHGWLLYAPALPPGTARQYASSENPTEAARPVLRIEYQPPAR